MLEAVDVEGPLLGVVELHQVDRGEVAGRVVKEHVFRTRVARIDPAAFGAGVPGVDGRVELDTGIGALPCGEADVVPELV